MLVSKDTHRNKTNSKTVPNSHQREGGNRRVSERKSGSCLPDIVEVGPDGSASS